jgi:hypothetical protein
MKLKNSPISISNFARTPQWYSYCTFEDKEEEEEEENEEEEEGEKEEEEEEDDNENDDDENVFPSFTAFFRERYLHTKIKKGKLKEKPLLNKHIL